MASPEAAQASFLGVTLKDAITLIIVPIIAVLTTLIYQGWQQQRDRRMQVLRMLLATRHLPADGNWNAAINLIPVEFNGDGKVMKAWRDYIEQVRFKPAPENADAHMKQVVTKQTKLITAVMTTMRLKHSEADIQADAYASEGFVNRDNLWLDSLRAHREGAEAMKGVRDALVAQAVWLQGQVNGQTKQ